MPVSAANSTSRPLSSAGPTTCCAAHGAAHPIASSAATPAADTPNDTQSATATAASASCPRARTSGGGPWPPAGVREERGTQRAAAATKRERGKGG